LKTNFSRILGREFEDTGYLDFKKWTDSEEYCKHFIKYKQKEFFRRIDKNIKQSKNKLIQEYKNQSEIPVWLIVDVLTFGEILDLYKLMKKRSAKTDLDVDIHENSRDYLEKVYENAKFVAKKYGWCHIDCEEDGYLKSVDDIHHLILNNL